MPALEFSYGREAGRTHMAALEFRCGHERDNHTWQLWSSVMVMRQLWISVCSSNETGRMHIYAGWEFDINCKPIANVA
jgi:hypothetical protein